jgi:hypothetical protein
MHETNPVYGTVTALRHLNNVLAVYKSIDGKSLLDYGCGKGMLAKQLDFPIWEYDPAIPGKDNPPRPADLVVAIDVLEHIEPEYLDRVIDDIYRCTKKIAFFAIGTQPSTKTLPDGRNTHLIVQDKQWWMDRLKRCFMFHERGVFDTLGCNEFCFVVAPKPEAGVEKDTGILLDEKECVCAAV